MIVFLKGILTLKLPTWIELNVNGVGYGITVPVSTFDVLPALHEEVFIHTYQHVKEDTNVLFGFHTPTLKTTFCLLISVSGIGPKVAIAILSSLKEEQIQSAILNGDIKLLSSVPGIGKKTAERLILDLRDKMRKMGTFKVERVSSKAGVSEMTSIFEDSVSALITLGYSSNDSRKAIQKIYEDLKGNSISIENCIREGLNLLIKKK